VEIYLIKIRKGNGEERFYIGQTKLTSEIRFKQHCYGDQLVDKKIRQYGIENTELLVMAKGIESAEELDRLEILYIKLFESFVGWNKGGYNVSLGGKGNRTVEIDRDELQSYVDQGLSMTEMSKRFGNISISTLSSWMMTYEIKRKSLFEQNEAIIRQMVAEKKSVYEISKATGIVGDAIRKEFKKLKIKTVIKKPNKLTQEKITQIQQLTEEGKSSREIERLIGINHTTIQEILRKSGIKSKATVGLKNKATAVTKELIVKVLQLKATGISRSAIARELGCSVVTINSIVNGKYDHLLN